MHSLRRLAHKHISKNTLHASLVITLCAFGFSCWSLYDLFKISLDDQYIDTAPIEFRNPAAVRLARAHEDTPPPSTDVPDRSFTVGEESAEVLALQRFLAWKELLPEDKTNAYFGPSTLAALNKYQELHHIPVSKVVGPLTREAWKKDISIPSSTIPSHSL